MNQELRVINDCKQLLVDFVECVTPTMDKYGQQKHVFTFLLSATQTKSHHPNGLRP